MATMTKAAGKPEREFDPRLVEHAKFAAKHLYPDGTNVVTLMCVVAEKWMAEAYAQSEDGTGPTVHEANDLLRQLNVEVFNDGIDIAKLPYAVGLVLDFAKLAEAVSPEQGKPPRNDWKEAVIDACVVNHIGWDENDPRKTISQLIAYENTIALDPRVSAAAQALIDRGAASSQGATSEPMTCPNCGSDKKNERLDVDVMGSMFDYPCGHDWHDVPQSAPEPPSQLVCPKCHGEIKSGAHGSWCPKPTCKWGWEIEMDGSPLQPPVMAGSVSGGEAVTPVNYEGEKW